MNSRLAALIVSKYLSALAAMIVFFASAKQAEAQGKFSGLAYTDYYYVIANHNKALQDENGFWIRRVYFTYDQELAGDFDTRFRFEMLNKGDFTTDEKLVPYVKDAYLRWKRGLHSVLVGISPSPTWNVLEDVWGYRSVEKTPLDLQKMGSSREFGVAAQGSFDTGKKMKYHIMIGNGKGEGSETNRYKKLLASLGFNPADEFVIEMYGDYEAYRGRFDRYTLQAFGAWRTDEGRVGVMFTRQTRQAGVDSLSGKDRDSEHLDVGSIFGVLRVFERVDLLARFDRTFDPNPAAEKIAYLPFASNSESNFLLAGVDLEAADNVHVIPSVEVVTYRADSGDDPDSDAIARVTVFYQWK